MVRKVIIKLCNWKGEREHSRVSSHHGAPRLRACWCIHRSSAQVPLKSYSPGPCILFCIKLPLIVQPPQVHWPTFKYHPKVTGARRGRQMVSFNSFHTPLMLTRCGGLDVYFSTSFRISPAQRMPLCSDSKEQTRVVPMEKKKRSRLLSLPLTWTQRVWVSQTQSSLPEEA